MKSAAFRKASMVKDLLVVAVQSLNENKLRTILTLLGLTIGVTSLITVMTIIEGANDYVADQIANLGSNVFQVTKLANIADGIDAFIKSFRRKDITWDNYRYVRDNIQSAPRVGAQTGTSEPVQAGDLSIEDATIEGATANMIEIGTREIDDGRFFSDQEQRFARFVGVIGWDVRDKLFPGQDPIGKYLKVGQTPVQVVGVCKKQGSIPGISRDNFVTIPITAFFKKFGSRRSLDLFVQTRGPNDYERAADEVRLYLRTVRHRKYHDPDDFTIQTSDTTIKLFKDITGSFFMVFLMLTAVAALVGGIVIMNIMMVSVTDRTMEIGVRRAVGCARGGILIQFLLETLVLCASGGLLGVVLGFVLAELFCHLAGIPAAVKPWVALFGVVLSSLIGLFFGIYPAWKAAGLDPVEALRWEK